MTVPMDDECVSYTSIEHCTAAAESVSTKCAFWHRPTPSGTECEAHSLWWVIFIIVVIGLLVLVAAIVCVVVLVNRIMRKVRVEKQREPTCIFTMSRSNVVFVAAKRFKDVVLNKQIVAFSDDGAVPVGATSKELL